MTKFSEICPQIPLILVFLCEGRRSFGRQRSGHFCDDAERRDSVRHLRRPRDQRQIVTTEGTAKEQARTAEGEAFEVDVDEDPVHPADVPAGEDEHDQKRRTGGEDVVYAEFRLDTHSRSGTQKERGYYYKHVLNT